MGWRDWMNLDFNSGIAMHISPSRWLDSDRLRSENLMYRIFFDEARRGSLYEWHHFKWVTLKNYGAVEELYSVIPTISLISPSFNLVELENA